MFVSCDEYLQLDALKDVAYSDTITDAVAKKLYKFRSLADKNTDGQWYVNVSKNIYKICQERINKQSSKVHSLVSNYRNQINEFYKKNDVTRQNFEIQGFGTYDEIRTRIEKCNNKFKLLPRENYGYYPDDGEIEHIFEYVNCMSERT